MKKIKQNSNNCKEVSKLLLPEDLIFHILTLVPLNCLFNSARYVCKPWAATIASSLFVETCERRARSKPGLYVQNCTTTTSSYFLEFKDGVMINGQLERTDLGTPQRMGNIISTCDGILLLWNSHQRETFVVNPILKCWLRIPCFPISRHHTVIRSQCTITRVPRTAKFKLFFVNVLQVSETFWYVFYVLRIGIDNSWKEIAAKEAPIKWHFYSKPLYSGDNDVYWVTHDKVFVMDVDKELILQQYSLSHVPMFHGPPTTLLRIGNRLSCIAAEGVNKTYQISILDFESGNWILYHEVRFFDFVAVCRYEQNIENVVFRFWINDQIIFRVDLGKHNKYIHFCYNVKTRQLTKIEDIDMGNFEVWLFSNSLVPLPSTLA